MNAVLGWLESDVKWSVTLGKFDSFFYSNKCMNFPHTRMMMVCFYSAWLLLWLTEWLSVCLLYPLPTPPLFHILNYFECYLPQNVCLNKPKTLRLQIGIIINSSHCARQSPALSSLRFHSSLSSLSSSLLIWSLPVTSPPPLTSTRTEHDGKLIRW